MIAGLLATSLVAGVCYAGMASAQEAGQDTENVEAQEAAVTTDEVQDPVESAIEESGTDAAAVRRKSLISDAVEALDETQKALTALDDGDTEAALESLAVATGKLDLVIARNPSLALAPIDVRMVTHDLYATVEDIEEIRDRAAKHLKNGRLQDARALIEGLRSDIVVEVYNVPLATYPAAIKAITPLIDADKIEQAKVGLQSALNTVVVTQHIHSLPVLRAEHMLTRAEELAEMEDRKGEQNEELTRLLDGARSQLEFAQVLGYGQASDFKGFYEQLDKIAEKTGGGKSGTGFFDVIRNALRSIGNDPSS
tara:strand:+ start:1267 stop:2199 length:933 start_codon:yes stop_codon:yes gene_type:complete